MHELASVLLQLSHELAVIIFIKCRIIVLFVCPAVDGSISHVVADFLKFVKYSRTYLIGGILDVETIRHFPVLYRKHRYGDVTSHN